MKRYLILWIIIFYFLPKLQAEDFSSFKVKIEEPHEIVLLNHGLSSLEERLEMIENAQTSIDVEYFIFNLDQSGRMFTQALVEKAKQGVKVRMLLDYFMVKNKFTPFFAHEMAKYGIEVKYYNVTSLLNIFKGQYRNHRKLLIVDGNEVITGGRNIGDEYFDLSDKFNFLDRDIKIRGSIVTHIQDTFNKVWDSKQTRILKRQKEPAQNDPSYSNSNKGAFGYDHDKFRQDLSNWKRKVIDAIEFLTKKDNRFVDEDLRAKAKSILAREYHGICNKMSFNSEYPLVGKASRKERVIKHDISERIKNAKEKILFDSPYFIVDDESQSALKEALDNQTQVVLLTNSLHSTDAIYVYAAFDNLIKKWINAGLQTYVYKGNSLSSYEYVSPSIANSRFGLHAKSFVFDNKDVIIGTFNFDPRSANFNTELTVGCEDSPELAYEVTQDIENRIQNSFFLDSSKTVDDVEFYKIGFFKRLEYLFIKIPANFLEYLL